MTSLIAEIDTLRSLGFASISGAYAPVGSAFAFPVRLICITNNTNGDMIFSNDGSTDKLFIAKSSFKLFDITANKALKDSYWSFPVGTRFYVKQSTAATSGSVYIECIYAKVTS